MMFDPSRRRIDDIKVDVKTSEMIFPGLDEALAFDEFPKHVEDPNWMLSSLILHLRAYARFLSLPEIIEVWSGRLIR